MVFNAPSLSGTWLAAFVASVHFILKCCVELMSFFLTFAGLAVVTEVGRGAVRPAVGDLVACVVGSLGDERLGLKGVASGWFVFAHQALEEIFDVCGGECSIGLGRRRHVGVVIFVVGGWSWVCLVERRLIDKLF